MLDDWHFYFSFFVMAALLFTILSVLFLRLTLDRRVRKALPSDKSYDAFSDHYFGFGRTVIFGYASIFTRANYTWPIQLLYEGFNIKQFSNNFEKALAYCMVFSISVFVLGGLFFLITRMFGIVEWPES